VTLGDFGPRSGLAGEGDLLETPGLGSNPADLDGEQVAMFGKPIDFGVTAASRVLKYVRERHGLPVPAPAKTPPASPQDRH
jgi:hypothetical protein